MLTVLNVPNFLTLLRLVAIPCFLILLEDFRYREALGVFVAAGVTDALDGAIARLTHTKTTLGAYLDPGRRQAAARVGVHRARLHARGAALARR